MTTTAHRAPYRRPTVAHGAVTGIYRRRPCAGRLATELVAWLRAHALSPSRIPTNATLIAGGGRLSIDYLVTADDLQTIRGRLMLPLLVDRPIPAAFRIIENEDA